MAITDGPTLDRLVREAKLWYNTMRQRLIETLERDGYPYGTVRLTEEEQLFKYLRMTPLDWSNMTSQLLQKYRGRTDALRLAGQDLQRYRQHMELLKAKYEARTGQPIRTSMESMASSMMSQAGLPTGPSSPVDSSQSPNPVQPIINPPTQSPQPIPPRQPGSAPNI